MTKGNPLERAAHRYADQGLDVPPLYWIREGACATANVGYREGRGLDGHG